MLDTNVLVYAFDRQSTFHERAKGESHQNWDEYAMIHFS